MDVYFLVFHFIGFMEYFFFGETCRLLGLEDSTKFPDSIFNTFGLKNTPISYLRLNQPGFSLPHRKAIRISFGNLIKYF